jgi:hypothetical protein
MGCAIGNIEFAPSYALRGSDTTELPPRRARCESKAVHLLLLLRYARRRFCSTACLRRKRTSRLRMGSPWLK